MHYLIDGYNLLFQLDTKLENVEESRLEMLSSLVTLLPSLQMRATIVFDNRYYHALDVPTIEDRGGLEVIFTPKNLTADEYILELLETAKPLSQQVVVTSDRQLVMYVKDAGAKTQSVDAFFALLQKKRTARKKKFHDQKKTFQSQRDFDRLLRIFTERDRF